MPPTKLENKSLFNSDMNLWNQCDVVNLTSNFRVGDSTWNQTLQRIRFGEQTAEDLKLLKTRYTSNFHRSDWDDCLHTFYSKKECFNHNKRVLNKLDGKLQSIKAEIPKGKKPHITDWGTIDDTPYLEYLELKKGANVIMVNNIDVSDGLVNGVTGKVLDYVWRNINGKSEIYAIIVKFDDNDVGKKFRKENMNLPEVKKYSDGVPIFKVKLGYKATRKASTRQSGKDLSTRQFPLNLAFASTGHKLQGRTIKDQEIVVHGHGNLDKGEGYVMLSRCKNLDQVFLDKSFIPEKHLKVHPESLVEARKLEERCIAAKLKKESFDLFYTNMRYKNRFIDIQHDPMANQSSVVCLAQTCLDPNEEFDWESRTSKLHASSGNGKGVACFSDGKMDTEFINKLQTDKFQLIHMTMKDKFQIFLLYISPNSNHTVYEQVSTSIEEFLLPGFTPIILGDCNFDHHTTLNNPLSNYLKNDLGLKQIISETTFALSKNTIDHVYVSPDLEGNIKVSSRFNYYSDHQSFNLSFE